MSDLHAAHNEHRGELRKHFTARRSLVELLTDPNIEEPLELYRGLDFLSVGFGMEAEITGKLLRPGV